MLKYKATISQSKPVNTEVAGAVANRGVRAVMLYRWVMVWGCGGVKSGGAYSPWP
jgi:hypothetical protein